MTLHALKDPVPGQQFLKPAAGKRWVAVDVTITNTAQEEVPYNPFYFKVKAADNTEVNITIGGQEPGLKSGKLAPGDSVRGWVTFEMPEGVEPASMTYEIISLGNTGRIVFDLQ
jgi:hypothetical protein